MSLIAELKRRNVFRMGAAYLVVAWLVVQVASIGFPAFEAPPWALRVFILALMLGFPVALVLAWVLEITPEGVKVDRPGVGTKRLVAVTVLIALGAVAWFLRTPAGKAPAAATAAVAPNVPAAASAPAPVLPPSDARSIVVLPFADMSATRDQEYLSDGIAEELLNLLAKVPELRVVSRSTAFSFKGKALDVPTIAAQLGVAHVLEGSVRKAGNRVRITVQLIDATRDVHTWSETYDRELDDIFAIQDDIARAVVDALEVRLLGKVPRSVPTDPAAYALVLQARQLLREASASSLPESVALFRQALGIAPDYAAGWSGLASVYTVIGGRGLMPVDEAYVHAKDAAERALAIDPNHAAAHAVLGNIFALDDLPAAARHTLRALELAPRDSEILRYTVMMALFLDRRELAVRASRVATAADPLSSLRWILRCRADRVARDYDAAIAACERSLALAPRAVATHHYLAYLHLLRDAPADVARALEHARAEPDEAYRTVALAMAELAAGNRAAADAALATARGKFVQRASYNIAYAHAFRGEPDAAFAALDDAVRHRDIGLNEIPSMALFEPLHGDPRWRALLERLHRTPEELAAIPFDVRIDP